MQPPPTSVLSPPFCRSESTNKVHIVLDFLNFFLHSVVDHMGWCATRQTEFFALFIPTYCTVNVFFSSKGLPCTLQAVAPLTARLEAFTETVQAPSPYFPQFYRRVSFTKHRFFYKLGVDPDKSWSAKDGAIALFCTCVTQCVLRTLCTVVFVRRKDLWCTLCTCGFN